MKYEYKCPICGTIYKSNQEPQQIFICGCGKVDIPLYSINLRYCSTDKCLKILKDIPDCPRYKWVSKDKREFYVDEMPQSYKDNLIRILTTK